MMNRRAFVTGLGAVLAAPLAVEAQPAGKQQRAMPHVGVLVAESAPHPFTEAFRSGMRELGYVEGRTIAIEWRYANALFARGRAGHRTRDTTQAGGLISYSADHAAYFQRAAIFVDKILKGARPGDLPIEQPNKFELVINVKPNKVLGLTVPPSLLLRADQMIE